MLQAQIIKLVRKKFNIIILNFIKPPVDSHFCRAILKYYIIYSHYTAAEIYCDHKLSWLTANFILHVVEAKVINFNYWCETLIEITRLLNVGNTLVNNKFI